MAHTTRSLSASTGSFSKSVQFSRFIKISFTYPEDEYDRTALEPAKLTFSEASELMQLRIQWKQEMKKRVDALPPPSSPVARRVVPDSPAQPPRSASVPSPLSTACSFFARSSPELVSTSSRGRDRTDLDQSGLLPNLDPAPPLSSTFHYSPSPNMSPAGLSPAFSFQDSGSSSSSDDDSESNAIASTAPTIIPALKLESPLLPITASQLRSCLV